ncbi:MAG: restriction endonuclease subunit S [bacterium]|nr:restriction endonuclease subunit S [bacterium]
MKELRPYRMKDSGVEWLGDVPAHWEVAPLGRIGRFFKGNGGTKAEEAEEGVPCVRYGDLYTYHDFHIASSKAFVESGVAATTYTPIKFGDVLFAGSGETVDEIGKSAANLMVDPACCGGDVIVFRPRVNADARFLGYATDCQPAARQKARMGRGFTVIHIYGNDLKYLTIAIPPLPEQVAIARFLDHATNRIDRHIRAKEKLINLWEEQKQAIIDEAVTGRIEVRTGEPYANYRDSRIEWLGNVPARWQIRELGRMGRFFKGSGGTKADETNEGTPCVRYGDLYTTHRFHVRETRSFVDPAVAATTYTPIEYGDVLFAGSGETIDEIGKSAVNLMCGGCCGGDVIVFRPNIEVDAAFLGYATDCRYAARQKARMGRGFTVMHIYSTDLKYMIIALPPLSDQVAIAGFLERVAKDMDGAIYRAQSQIELAVEYRASLIADVITGKLDVRSAAAELPEVEPLTSEHGAHADGVKSNSFGTERGIAREANP